MKLMTMKQYMKISKPALIRKITKTLRAMPKKRLARLCYDLTKSKLPQLKYHRFEPLPHPTKGKERYLTKSLDYAYKPKRKTKRLAGRTYVRKRKFSRKQLAAQRLFAKRARAGTLRRR